MSEEDFKKIIEETLLNNSREWIKEIQQDVSVVYVDDFIDELTNKILYDGK